MNGLAQETCRDLPHTQMGLAGIINFAETAWIQGRADVYTHHASRIVTSFEFHSYWMTRGLASTPSDLCNGNLNQVTNYYPFWEIFYNHFKVRLNYNLPNTTTVVNRVRNQGPYYVHLTSAWEILTHCGVNSL